MFYCLIVWFILFNIEIYCLKIKIEALTLVKTIRKTDRDNLIEHLISSGPRNLLAELVNLQTADFKSTACGKCAYMTSSEILDIIQDYEEGNLTFEQYKTILSADCASKWGYNVFNELAQLELYDKLPANFLESKYFNANRMHPDTFLIFLTRAFRSENRETIFWNRWTSKIGFKESKSFYNHQIWRNYGGLWQTISFRNFANIKDDNIMGRAFLVSFVGLKGENLELYSLTELFSRFYTLLSFIKLWEIDYSKVVGPNDCDNDFMESRILKNSAKDIAKLLSNIQNRINEIDSAAHLRLEKLVIFSLTINENKEPDEREVNDFLVNFINDSENIQLGDWILGILCILIDVLDLISYENLRAFLRMFFDLKPSIDSIIFTYKLLREKRIFKDEINELFYENLKDKPTLLIELYKSNGRVMPKELIMLVPLGVRCIRNLKNRYGEQSDGQRVLEFNLLADPNASDLQKFMEMVQVIGWSRINMFHAAFYRTFEFDDDEYDAISIDKIVKTYFELFLGQREFYEIVNYDEVLRPIIRISPVFPSELWHQLAHLMTRASLFKIEIPFVLDFEFFRESFEQDELSAFAIEMGERIKLAVDEKWKGFYQFLHENIALTPLNLENTLKEITLRLETLRQTKTETESKSESKAITNDTNNIICIESKIGNAAILLAYGFKSFIEGLNYGFNLEDFSIEEAHKLIFHHQ